MRIGLCCTFLEQPIKFRATTARFVSSKLPAAQSHFLHPPDVPRCWLGRRMTVDVEAKAKERAVLRFRRWISAQEGRGAACNRRLGACDENSS